jgi:hypothetical protein
VSASRNRGRKEKPANTSQQQSPQSRPNQKGRNKMTYEMTATELAELRAGNGGRLLADRAYTEYNATGGRGGPEGDRFQGAINLILGGRPYDGGLGGLYAYHQLLGLTSDRNFKLLEKQDCLFAFARETSVKCFGWKKWELQK